MNMIACKIRSRYAAFAINSDSIHKRSLTGGAARIMLSDEFPTMGGKSPQTLGGSPVAIMLYVEDVDSVYRQAVAAGAKEDRPVQDQFYGDRSGSVIDPFGHKWFVATHKEDVPPEEMKRRMAEAMTPA